MADWKRDDIDPQDVQIEAEGETGGPEAIEQIAEGKIKKMKGELETCRQEKQEYMDGWQRAKADYVNALKRFDEEKKVEHNRGIEKAVTELLPAYDALERAKEHGDVPEGFSGIVKQLEGAFASLGLAPLGAVGEVFDPAIHDAMGQDAAGSAEQDGQVSVVLERGFRMGDTVIRPAKVRVAHWTSN